MLCLGSLRSQWTLYFDLTVSFSTCHDSVSASSLSVCDTQISSHFLIRRTGCQQLMFSPVNYNLNVIVYCNSTQQVFIILKIWFKCEYWNLTFGNFLFFFDECDRLAEKLYLEWVKQREARSKKLFFNPFSVGQGPRSLSNFLGFDKMSIKGNFSWIRLSYELSSRAGL